jgi:hypothetical protein
MTSARVWESTNLTSILAKVKDAVELYLHSTLRVRGVVLLALLVLPNLGTKQKLP